LEYLSNIELYFCSSDYDDKKYFVLHDDEFHHATKVMRNKTGDKLFATDGNGKIFEGVIEEIDKSSLKTSIIKTYNYKNIFSHLTFCIPNLKNPERLKFAFEKCTELGITNFILFKPEHSVGKNLNAERLSKITLAAMKQSLRAFLPKIEAINSLSELTKNQTEIILFDQIAESKFSNFNLDENRKYVLVFGPEGGFSEKELMILKSAKQLKLTDNRLRTETAIVKAASMIC
jgi:16S rRNA (uracil1498-N3)-methyltransferase